MAFFNKSTSIRPKLTSFDREQVISGHSTTHRAHCYPGGAEGEKFADISLRSTRDLNGAVSQSLKCPEQAQQLFQTKCKLCLLGDNCPTELIMKNFPTRPGVSINL